MMSSILFNGIAVIVILFIVIWFWIIKSKSTAVQQGHLDIYVKDGAYTPNRIETTQSQITLNFIRQDASPCAEYVLFEQLDVRAQLPLNQSYPITLTALQPGRYRFTCQMGMYQGELIVSL